MKQLFCFKRIYNILKLHNNRLRSTVSFPVINVCLELCERPSIPTKKRARPKRTGGKQRELLRGLFSGGLGSGSPDLAPVDELVDLAHQILQ